MTLIAEDLLLLLTDDEDGTLVQQSHVNEALAGAVLAELAAGGYVTLSESKWGEPKVAAATVSSPPEHPVLARALDIVAAKERTAQSLLPKISQGLREELFDSLAARGILRREEGRTLGLFSRTTWPAVDSAHEEEVRTELRATLIDQQPPGPRAAALIGLLHSMGLAHKLLDRGDLSAREIKKRAKAVAEGDFAASAVSRAAEDAVIAIVTASMVPIVISTTTT